MCGGEKESLWGHAGQYKSRSPGVASASQGIETMHTPAERRLISGRYRSGESQIAHHQSAYNRNIYGAQITRCRRHEKEQNQSPWTPDSDGQSEIGRASCRERV